MFLRVAAVRLPFSTFLLAASVVILPQAIAAHVRQTVRKSPSAANEASHERFANEPFVIERHYLTVRFESDGTETRELFMRLRVQSDAGAQQFRHLAFEFVSPNEDVSVRSATIRKANGSIVDILAQPNATKIGTPPTGHDFPAYTSLKELRVNIPSLQAGDTLDYDVVTRTVKPPAPGEFWFSYDFPRDAVILDDRLELNLPQGRAFRIRAPEISLNGMREHTTAAPSGANEFAFTRTDERGRAILRWKRSNLKPTSDDQPSQQARTAKTPDVQITSFQSWAAVAKWYAQAEQSASQVTPRIQAKVKELVRGATNDEQKAEAIFAYVSQHVRDVDLSQYFGQMAPRPARDVLASGYGGGEEKNALLAAMLDAAGIHSNVALIASARKLDRALPSPAQFDRVISVVNDGEKSVWIDPSAQLAPFGFLPATLRGQRALVIQADRAATFVSTPLDPPFLSTQKVEIDAQLNELGKLSGTVRYSLRGDTEYVLRTAFHRSPQAQWKSLAQTILTLDGLRGQVTNVTTTDPLDTRKPFEVTVAFSDPSAFLWPMRRTKIALPLLTIGMPDPPAKSGDAIELGTPLDVETHLQLRFPAGFSVTSPAGTAVSRDYAEFKSSYRVENGELVAERAMNFRMRELPSSRKPDYVAFVHAVQADEAQALFIANPAGAKADIPPNATADDLVDAGTAALKAGRATDAILLLERATHLQPNHKTAWTELGLAYLQSHKPADAVAAFQKQAQVSTSDDRVHDYLGVALEQLHRDDDAANAFRKQIAIEPLDPVAHAQLGDILLRQERYSDAVPELEKAAILSPGNAELQILLGRAYLDIGDKDKGLASLRKATQLSRSAQIRNEAAYVLAQQGTDLDQARQYAESAIRLTAEALDKTDLAHTTAAEFAQTADIGAYWDTLGWVYFKQGELAKAERYVHAAWLLTENGEVGDHLAQIYMKSGQKDAATHQCALALAGSDPVPDTRARLMLLLGGNAQIDDMVAKARPELEDARTFTLKLPVKEKASANFLIAMSPDAGGKTSVSARVDAVRFVSGDEALRKFADELKLVHYGDILPDPTQMKLVRRGALTCSAASECKLTLLPAGSGEPN